MILKGQLSADTALLIDWPVLMRADPAAADQLIPPQQMEKLSVKQLEDRPADDVQLVKPVIVSKYIEAGLHTRLSKNLSQSNIPKC